MASEIHPLDFQSLKKDTVIDRSLIERIYNVRKDLAPEAFRLCQLKLSSDIERERRDLLCKIQGDDLRIMTDSEANEHTWKEYKRGVNKIAKQARRRTAIDAARLPEDERRVSDLRDQHIAVQAILNRRELAKAQRAMLFGGDGEEPKLGSDPQGET